jgi:hypothetical protein
MSDDEGPRDQGVAVLLGLMLVGLLTYLFGVAIRWMMGSR